MSLSYQGPGIGPGLGDCSQKLAAVAVQAKEALDTLLAIEPDHPDGKKFHEKVSKALRSKHEDIGKRLEAMGKVIGVS